MTFLDWLFSTDTHPRFENPVINGRWGLLHILTMLICAALIVGFWLIVKKCKNKDKARKIIIGVLAGLILLFEIVMKTVNFYNFAKAGQLNVWRAFWILIPRPWCAVSCWALMISVLVNKKFFYNFASMSALLCAALFFACPGVGFNNEIILFQNLYSIVTHALLLTMSITLITLKFTDFRYKTIWKELSCFVVIYIWAIIEIFVLHFERDPFYFMPDGDIQAGIFKISYVLYIVIYVVFIALYINTFYLINDRQNVKKLFAKNRKSLNQAD